VSRTRQPLWGVSVSGDGTTIAAAGNRRLYITQPAGGGARSIGFPASAGGAGFPGSVGRADVSFAGPDRVLVWSGPGGALLDFDLATGTVVPIQTGASGWSQGYNNTLLYAAATGAAYALVNHIPGSGELAAVDVQARTWSSKQIPGLQTIAALTLDERVLIASLDPSLVLDSIGLYDPTTNVFSPDLAAVPAGIRDLKIIAV
jgi:hypothetical protein